MSHDRMSTLKARILANAQSYKIDPDHDGADLAFEDPAFDAALDAAGRELVDLLGDRATAYLADLYHEACALDEIPDRPVTPKGRRGTDDLIPIEEHSLVFVPINGPIAEIEAFLQTPGRSALVASGMRQQSLIDPYSRIALYPGTWNAEILSRVGPGLLRRVLEAAVAARTTRTPADHQAALKVAVESVVPVEADVEATPSHTIAARCLVLHRIRNGYDAEPNDGRGPLGSNLDDDPLLRPSADLNQWAASQSDGHRLFLGVTSEFLTARTRMTTGQVAIQCTIERIAADIDRDGPADCLYLYRDPVEHDHLTFAARYGQWTTSPITIDASLAMGDMKTMMLELELISPTVIPLADRESFEAAIHGEDRALTPRKPH